MIEWKTNSGQKYFTRDEIKTTPINITLVFEKSYNCMI